MESHGDLFKIFDELTFESDTQKREICAKCRRPVTVCLCKYLPPEILEVRKTTLHILQHPNEDRRPLNTVSILRTCLGNSVCAIYRGRRFHESVYPSLHKILKLQNTFLLFPGNDAKNIADIVSEESNDFHYNVIILDGTWKQAFSIYAQNKFLKNLPKVQLQGSTVSEYVIRTQPTESSLSTLECAAMVLEHTEKKKELRELLLQPLRGLCRYQLDHGASVHQSKEFLANHAN